MFSRVSKHYWRTFTQISNYTIFGLSALLKTMAMAVWWLPCYLPHFAGGAIEAEPLSLKLACHQLNLDVAVKSNLIS